MAYVAAGLSPIVGYHFTRTFFCGGRAWLSVLPGILTQTFLLHSRTITYYDKENIVYPNIWARYLVYRGLYVAGTFEYNFIGLSEPNAYYDPLGNEYIQQDKLNVAVPSLLLGIGYRHSLGGV